MESKIVLYLLQDLFDDMSKRNLFTHKQFLLQRFFDFTGNKNSGRTPINPFKLKGFLLHLPEPQTPRNSDWNWSISLNSSKYIYVNERPIQFF